MIESCTKKRMLLAITILGGLTVIVLIVESQWTESSNNNKLYTENFERNATCVTDGEYEIISECHPCTAFEIASKSIGVCMRARYKEIIKCKNGEVVTRSCDRVAWLEELSFLKFEGFMFVLSMISCVTVFWRENILRKRVIRKVARQLRSSV